MLQKDFSVSQLAEEKSGPGGERRCATSSLLQGLEWRLFQEYGVQIQYICPEDGEEGTVRIVDEA